MSKHVNVLSFPFKPFFIDLSCSSFCRFSVEVFFKGKVPVLVPFLVCSNVHADVICYGSQAVEKHWIFREWVRVNYLGPDLIEVTLFFSAILSVVPSSNCSEQCT